MPTPHTGIGIDWCATAGCVADVGYDFGCFGLAGRHVALRGLYIVRCIVLSKVGGLSVAYWCAHMPLSWLLGGWVCGQVRRARRSEQRATGIGLRPVRPQAAAALRLWAAFLVQHDALGGEHSSHYIALPALDMQASLCLHSLCVFCTCCVPADRTRP